MSARDSIQHTYTVITHRSAYTNARFPHLFVQRRLSFQDCKGLQEMPIDVSKELSALPPQKVMYKPFFCAWRGLRDSRPFAARGVSGPALLSDGLQRGTLIRFLCVPLSAVAAPVVRYFFFVRGGGPSSSLACTWCVPTLVSPRLSSDVL